MRQITLIGAGALGSHVALLLRNLDGALRVVDDDRVERKNLASQLHTRMGVGRNKAQALAQTLHALYGVRVEAVPRRLVADNAEALLAGSALVLDCVDNAPTRRLIQSTAARLGVPCLHGGLAVDGAYARVMWASSFTVDDGGEDAATCEDGEHLAFIVEVAARMARTAQRFWHDGVQEHWHVNPQTAVAV